MNLKETFTQIGKDVKEINTKIKSTDTKIGNTSSLTNREADLVTAINALVSKDSEFASTIATIRDKLGNGNIDSTLGTDIVGALTKLKEKIATIESNGATNESEVNTLIDKKITALIDSAPENLNTLKELADELTKSDTALQGLVSKVTTISEKAEVDTDLLSLYTTQRGTL